MKCRVCDSENHERVIDLGEQPWCNNFLNPQDVGKEPYYPLRVVYCNDCSTAQLDYTVKKEIMFADHTYLSGTTDTLSNHFKAVAERIHKEFLTGKSDTRILDIGSNDGTQLKHYQALGHEVLGVESSHNTAKIANEANVPTVNKFFNEQAVDEINKKFDIINAAGVFFHLEELHSVCRAIKKGLKGDGVFVVQFLYMKSIIENLAFDQIYHEHLLYYTLQTIQTLLERHGLAMFDARIESIHGGSMVAYVGHTGCREKTDALKYLETAEQEAGTNEIETYHAFAKRIEVMKEENLAFLKSRKEAGKVIYGFGAPVKGNTMLNYFGVGPELIDYLIERNPLRDGLYAPGSHIPLKLEDDVQEQPDVYYVLAWNFKKEILQRNEHLLQAGVEFFFPVNLSEE